MLCHNSHVEVTSRERFGLYRVFKVGNRYTSNMASKVCCSFTHEAPSASKMKVLCVLFAFLSSLSSLDTLTEARPTDDVSSASLSATMSPDNNEQSLALSRFNGWKGCSNDNRASILTALDDLREILGVSPVQDFANWRQIPEAIEFFGDAIADDYHGWSMNVEQNFRNAHDFAAGSSSVKVQVFCHDQSMEGPLRDECSSARQPDSVVVARNYLEKYGPALML